jgi:hypothetical protein
VEFTGLSFFSKREAAVNGQCSDGTNPSPQDHDRSAASRRDNQRDQDVGTSSIADPTAKTKLVSDMLRQAELSQRQRWIGFLSRQIALDILRDASVREDGEPC